MTLRTTQCKQNRQHMGVLFRNYLRDKQISG